MNEHVKWVLNQGARATFRRHGFKRPGGGGRFRRRGLMTEEWVCLTGRLVRPTVIGFCLYSWHVFQGMSLRDQRWPMLSLDLATGDRGDFAVQLAHVLDTQVLPGLAPAVERGELEQAARDDEASGYLEGALRFWQGLANEVEVARLEERLAQVAAEAPPF
jgi:hypothetical protein